MSKREMTEINETQPANKIEKSLDDVVNNDENDKNELNDEKTSKNLLNNFQFKSLLNEDNNRKLVFIHATSKINEKNINNQEDAIIILEKPHFYENEIKAIIDNNYPINGDISNDIYKKLTVYPSQPYSSMYLNIV